MKSDGERAFKEDVRNRAITARSSHNKKGGTRACRLSQDYMSKAELAAKNGEVISMKLNGLYSWGDFKAFPNDFQVEYINNLIEKYGVSMPIISQVVFGLSKSTLANHISSIGRARDIKQGFTTGGGGSVALEAAVERGKAGDERPFAANESRPTLPPVKTAVEEQKKPEPKETEYVEEVITTVNEVPAAVQPDPRESRVVHAPAEKNHSEPVAPKPKTETVKKGETAMDLDTSDFTLAAALLQAFVGKSGRVKIVVEVDA